MKETTIFKNMKDTKTKKIEDYLKEPYARILVPEAEGGYSAEILEFPGCYSYGETPDEAIDNLDEAAFGWIEAALIQGQTIPKPHSVDEPSGKYLLRLPRNLHKKAIQMAERERVSLNTFFVDAVATRVGAHDFYNRMVDRLESLSAQLTARTTNAIRLIEGIQLISITDSYFPEIKRAQTSDTDSNLNN